MTMQPSPACAALVKRFEGCQLRAYPDPATGAAPWTIGYGHTTGVQPRLVITQQQADGFLRDDLWTAAQTVLAAVRVPLNQNQFDALTSFVFNVGKGQRGVKDGFVVLKSGYPSTMLSKLNAGDYVGAAAEFSKWTRGAGHVLEGLVARRAAERALFVGQEHSALDP